MITKLELEEIEMAEHAISAFLELQDLGCPVKLPIDGDHRGHFWISAEDDGSYEWLDYYGNFFGTDQLNEILEKHGLYWEWYNPAYGNVYDS